MFFDKSDSDAICLYIRAGKTLRFFKKFLGFLGFNVAHAEHWTQEYDQLKSYTRRLTHALLC